MSTLWTPDGEHPVGRTPSEDPGRATGPAGGDLGGPGPEDFDEAALRAQIDEARARVAEAPPEVVVLNHAMGLYELGAIHLSASPPNLAGAALAIDAFGFLVEGLGDRLGPDVATLRDALGQIRLAFVQVKGTSGAPGDDAPASTESPAG